MRCWGVGEVSAYQSCVQFSGVTPVGPTTRRDTGYALVRGLLQTFHKSLLSILEEAGNGFLWAQVIQTFEKCLFHRAVKLKSRARPRHRSRSFRASGDFQHLWGILRWFWRKIVPFSLPLYLKFLWNDTFVALFTNLLVTAIQLGSDVFYF